MYIPCIYTYTDVYLYIHSSDLIQVGVNVPVFLCDSSKKEPSESGRAAGRAPAAMPVPCTNCTGFVFRNFSEDTI